MSDRSSPPVSARAKGHSTTRHLVVHLSSPDQLFVASPPSPTSPTYTEFTAQPAMDTVRDLILLHLPRRHTDVVLDLVLPADQVHPGMDAELTAAVRRWVIVQNRMEGESSEAAGVIGRRLFVFGVIAFFLLQTASITVKKWADQWDSYATSALGEGLSVTSWVMLWFPVQIFTMEAWRSGIRRRRMRALERMSVRVHRAGVDTPG